MNYTTERAAAAMIVVFVLSCFAAEVAATHYRYGHIQWSPGAQENQINFRMQNAWRRDHGVCINPATGGTTPCTGPGGFPGVGDIHGQGVSSPTFHFGDGNTLSISGGVHHLVTSIDVANNWYFGEMVDHREYPNVVTTIKHTYSTPGNYVAFFPDCCRISAQNFPNRHINNPDGSTRIETVVNVGTGNSSPLALIPPIVHCEIGAICSFPVAAFDPNGDSLRFRFSTPQEATGGSTFVQPGPPHAPNAASIDPVTGIFTWNTSGASLGGVDPEEWNILYSTQVTIEDIDGDGNVKSKVAVDFFIRLVPPDFEGLDETVSSWKQAAGSYLEFLDTPWVKTLLLIKDGITVVKCGIAATGGFPSLPGCVVGVTSTVFIKGTEWLAAIVADPPDDNFTEVVDLKPIEPVVPLDDSELAAAKAVFLTTLLEQNAILEAVLITLERWQGAAEAMQKDFVLLQAEALKSFTQLLAVNQAELRDALIALETEFDSAIGPVYDELEEALIQLAASGLSPEQEETLLEMGWTPEDIQIIKDILEELKDILGVDFHADLLAPLSEWAQFIDDVVLEALEELVNKMDAFVENLGTPSAPVFDSPPTSGSTMTAFVAETTVFTVQSSFPDPGSVVTLNVVGLPASATMTPTLPIEGNPVSSEFSWTPTQAQIGTYIVVFSATSQTGQMSTFPVTINVEESDCPNPPLGDLNGDGVVNAFDLFKLLSNWGCMSELNGRNGHGCIGDLNGDGVVNGNDLLILLSNWGPCIEEDVCYSHSDCNDNNPCTIDQCILGECVYWQIPWCFLN